MPKKKTIGWISTGGPVKLIKLKLNVLHDLLPLFYVGNKW